MAKKISKEKIIGKQKGTIKEFKDFISRGNVIDLAVGVIIGGAFGKIVTSIVNDILMPIIGVIIGGLNFSSLTIKFKDATIAYGAFIQNIIDFLIVSACIFCLIKFIEKFKKKEVKEVVIEEPKKDEQVVLLEEIRDLLKENNKKTKNK